MKVTLEIFISLVLFLAIGSTSALAGSFSCTSGVWKGVTTGVEVIDRGTAKAKKVRFKAKMAKCSGGTGTVFQKGYWPTKPTKKQLEVKFGKQLNLLRSYGSGDGGRHSTTDMYTVK